MNDRSYEIPPTEGEILDYVASQFMTPRQEAMTLRRHIESSIPRKRHVTIRIDMNAISPPTLAEKMAWWRECRRANMDGDKC